MSNNAANTDLSIECSRSVNEPSSCSRYGSITCAYVAITTPQAFLSFNPVTHLGLSWSESRAYPSCTTTMRQIAAEVGLVVLIFFEESRQ
jgi:hypothetical protein